MISLTTVMGPYGAIAGPILTIFSSILDIFGKPAEESQEGMLRRVLDDMALKSLQDEAVGMEKFYGTLQSQVKILSNNEAKITKEDLEPIYIVSYENYAVFGKIANKISIECFPGTFKSSEATSKAAQIVRCLDLLKVYCQLSLVRQMFLAQLAGVTKKKKLDVLSDSLLNLVSEAQKSDQEVLKFLTRPLDYPNARYTMYKLFSEPDKYPIVVSYVKKLDEKDTFDVELRKDVQIEAEFDKRFAMICNDLYLLGTCRLLQKVKQPGAIKHWDTKTKSIFIPPTLQVRGKLTASIFEKIKNKQSGPNYLGPLHGLGAFSHEELGQVTELHVFDETVGDVNQMVTICRGEGSDHWCQKIDEFTTPQPLLGIGGRDFTTPSSLLIPDGWEVTLIAVDKLAIGPIYGRQYLKGFCKQKWESIIARKAQVKDASSANKVIVCEKANFEGYCQQLGDEFLNNDPENPKEFSTATIPLQPTGTKKTCGVSSVGSIKVPALFSVYLYGKSKDILNGPWSGPIEIKSIGSETDIIGKVTVVPNIRSKKGARRHGIVHPHARAKKRTHNESQYTPYNVSLE